MKINKIGIVGMGIMGRGIAQNFLKNGYQLYLWNRTKKVADSFQSQGAISCSSPQEVAEKSELLFEITANDESSKDVWLGQNGILKSTNKKTIMVASSTLSISWIDELAAKCQKSGFNFMDIALTGGRVGAESGQLTLLAGGDKKVLKKITPSLKVISKNLFHFGPVGHGMRYKLILNYLQAAHMIAYGQAMKMAKSSKMDLKKVGSALMDRPGGVITQIANDAYFQDPDPVTFSIEWLTKDLTYAKKFAKNLDLQILDTVLDIYKKAIRAGHGTKDWASVNKLLEEKT